MSCKHCGKCCRYWSIDVPRNPDLGNWLAYHGVEVIDMGRLTRIRGEAKCAHLHTSGSGFKCNIYERRPEICREFLCDKALKGGD